jgi:4a-hydroxytetrahydrobiopterin dehydratase
MNDLKLMNSTIPKIGSPPLSNAEAEVYLPQIPEWNVIEIEGINRLERQYKFNNFQAALNFTVRIGELAEQEDHHPAILTEWGKVKVNWWTHAVGGLHLNDFILAAKSDQIYEN